MTGKSLRQEIAPTEAAVVLELYQRINAGHSLKSIARDFEARGIRKRSGQSWPARHLAIMVLRRVYIGERVYDPGHNGPIPSANAVITPAMWPAIVERSLWTAVQRKLTAPERNTRRPGRGIHLLSMIAKCDVCGGPLTVRRRLDLRRDEWMYVCHAKACIGVPYGALNDYAEQKIISYLREPGNLERLIVDPVDPVAAEAVEAEVQQIQRELDDLADQLSKAAITATLAARAEPGILARLKAADQRRDELTRPSALSGLFGGAKKSVTKWWRDAPMSTKREVVRYLCSPEYLGELRVVRAPKPGPRCPVEERVDWRPA